MVLSFATALGGGILRDLLIGAVPPASIRDRRYAIAAFVSGAVVFCFHHFVRQVPSSLILGLDAAELGLFAVAGAAKALDHGIDPFMAALIGTITGVGGGTVRDIFLARVPAVLRVDIYAVAAYRIGRDDRRSPARLAPRLDDGSGRCHLFPAAGGERLAALESAQSDRP